MWRGAAVVMLAALAAAGCDEDETRTARGPSPAPQARLVLERVPYMGVSCPAPNDVRCDRVGLAVWLERRAERVTAWIAGRRVELRSPGDFVTGRGTGWEGYLQPAGMTSDGPMRVTGDPEHWEGDPPVTVPVRLEARYPDGATASRTLRLLLHPGWG
jgi:hypothetical protein